MLPHLFAVVLLTTAVQAEPKGECGLNEEWRDCASHCEPTCDSRGKVCIQSCAPARCQCKPEFVRHNGQCVEKSQCESSSQPPSTNTCPTNERFVKCSSMCEPKCGETERSACIKMCGPAKCQCSKGFLRHLNGSCVQPNQCSPDTSPLPTSSHRLTCADLKCADGELCIMEQVQCFVPPCPPLPVCQYIGNPTCDDYKCPLGQQCTILKVNCFRAPCPGPRPVCIEPPAPTCDNHPCPDGEQCQLEQVTCIRAPCYPIPTCTPVVNDKAKRSIVTTESTLEINPTLPVANFNFTELQCGKNEVFERCFSGCEKICGETGMKACPKLCKMPGGCRCASGFVRTAPGMECIREKECSVKECGHNEVYDQCYHECEPSCDNMNPVCTEECGPGGCACSEGFVRSKGKCVPISTCSPRHTSS